MNRDYKVGDLVIFTDKKLQADWGSEEEVSVYGEIGDIIFTSMWMNNEFVYLLRFDIRNNLYVICCKDNQFKSIDHLKFKKWAKG